MLRVAFWLWDQEIPDPDPCCGSELPAVALRAGLTQLWGLFCQAWARPCAGTDTAESRLARPGLKKDKKMNKKRFFWRDDGMCTLTFCFPFHVLSNPETRTNCS